MSGFVKYKQDKKFNQLNAPFKYDGGKHLIERLIHLFEVRNRIELGDLLGITPGTFSTWTTRKTTPYELLIRIHLLTGWSMEYLCFGTGERGGNNVTTEDFRNEISEPTLPYHRGVLQVYSIKNGNLEPYEKFEATDNIIGHFKIKGNDHDLVIKDSDNLLFINSEENEGVSGKYLFSTNNRYQLGELKLLPDGNIYLLEGDEKYPITPEVTKIHGKVVSELKSV
ncbi:chromophore lyase [Shewanella sp. GutCb]|uniref:helix-turn-helix domain-containing protein n=1 Tax=Shewanella sp. GutCb TaxID=2058315 RepID=UPI000C7A7B03|nr:helix-turn-helix domain-containing protein [Shewanella sp. GutCb]PKG74825.1 chromophore lyase [Shewanella sp. GutCb]